MSDGSTGDDIQPFPPVPNLVSTYSRAPEDQSIILNLSVLGVLCGFLHQCWESTAEDAEDAEGERIVSEQNTINLNR